MPFSDTRTYFRLSNDLDKLILPAKIRLNNYVVQLLRNNIKAFAISIRKIHIWNVDAIVYHFSKIIKIVLLFVFVNTWGIFLYVS